MKVLFFGMLKDVTGRSEETVNIPDGATVTDVLEHYVQLYPRLLDYERSILIARNQEFSQRREAVHPDDEIAFMPPVSGGSGFLRSVEDKDGHFFALTRERIRVDALREAVWRGRDGALIVFEGVVRNQSGGRPTRYLVYECYEEMAVKIMAQIGREIAAAHQIDRIALVHRLGRMEIGETSVAVVVSAPHRKPAFAAALDGINRLKKLVPIWKKEYFEDGEVWVEGEWDDRLLTPR